MYGKQYKMEKLLSKNDGLLMLESHLQELREIHIKCLGTLNGILNTTSNTFNSRTKAVMYNNLVAEEAKAYFLSQSLSKSSIVEKYQSPHIVIDKRMILRFKKLGRNRLSRNNSTKRNNNIVNQAQLFPEYENQTYIEAGYVIDFTWTDIKVYIVCRKGKSNLWEHELKNVNEIFTVLETEAGIPLIGTMPITITAEETKAKIKKSDHIKIKSENS